MTGRLAARLAAWRSRAVLAPVLTLVGGTAVAQAAVFAARPLLTRMYAPEDFGELTLVTTAVSLLSAVAHGGYRFAVLLPEDDREATGLVGLALAGALATTALAALSVVIVAAWTGVAAAWWLLPPALLALDAGQTFETWLTRRDRFSVVSASRVGQAAAVVAVQLMGGVLGFLATGLVAGAAAGFAVSLAVSMGAVWRAEGRALMATFRPAAMRGLARRYARFPMFSAPAAALNLAATRLPILLLAAFAGEATVGQFGVAFGTLALPLGLVTGAAGQVFFVRAATAVRDGTLPELTRQTLRGLLAVTVFPSLAVMAAGPDLFALVFGETWRPAGEFARAIAPWTLSASIASPLTALFDVLERQRADLGFSIGMAAVQTVALVAAGVTQADPRDIVVIASIAGTVLRVGHVAWMLQIAGVTTRPVLADLGRAAAVAVPLAALVWAADGWGGGPAALVATALGGSVTLGAAARQRAG